MSNFVFFVKAHATFLFASLLAVITCFIVPPSKAYAAYIDWNTIAILFALMAVVRGFEKCGAFKKLGDFLTSLVSDTRSLAIVLVFLCFFISMFVTNDVALITFVPFAILLLAQVEGLKPWVLIFIVVLQTVAANTGSMLTPIGNPQNLFIFNKSGMKIGEFMLVLLPYTLLCAALLLAGCFLVPKIKLNHNSMEKDFIKSKPRRHKYSLLFRYALYSALFAVSILSVLNFIPKILVAAIILVTLLIFDRRILMQVDYFLLLTFIAFFIFSGNLASIPEIKSFLQNAVRGREAFVGIAASQVISNVPATLMLYGFSENIKNLLVGVNLGGLGTLVGSLASLISFNLYTAEKKNALGFLGIFTLVNVFFLAVLIVFYCW